MDSLSVQGKMGRKQFSSPGEKKTQKSRNYLRVRKCSLYLDVTKTSELNIGKGVYTYSSLVFSLFAWGIGERLDYHPSFPLPSVVP